MSKYICCLCKSIYDFDDNVVFPCAKCNNYKCRYCIVEDFKLCENCEFNEGISMSSIGGTQIFCLRDQQTNVNINNSIKIILNEFHIIDTDSSEDKIKKYDECFKKIRSIIQ
jgi:hypothetical protein